MALEKNEYKFPDELDEKENKSASEDEVIVEMEADSENEIDVEVVDDTPPRDRNRKPSEPPTDVTEDELKEYSDKVRKRIQHFSKGYHDERRAKEAALREREEIEKLASHLAEENKKLKSTVNKNQEVLLEQAKKEIASEVETAKRAYKQAYESGDADAVVDAQEALTTAKLKSEKVESFKFDPIEDDIGAREAPRPAVDHKAMEWAKANPWFGKDDEMTSYVLGLHNKLVKDRVDPKSDEYYEIIDSRMRKLFSDRFESEEDAEQETAPKPRRKANVVAPATRSTAPKKIVLNPRQVALAKKYGIPLQQYAQEVAKLGREQ